MRRDESNCFGCMAPSGYCMNCSESVIECDSCECEIDEYEAYAFPDDASDEDYCKECMINRIEDEKEFTKLTQCPECESEDTEVFKIRDYHFCKNCLEDLLEELRKGN